MYRRKSDFDLAFLYFLITETNVIKIGVTDNLRRRLRELKTACPFKIVAYKYTKYLEREDALYDELLFHRLFDAFRLNGEWFKFPGFMKFAEMREIFPPRRYDNEQLKIHWGARKPNYFYDYDFDDDLINQENCRLPKIFYKTEEA